MLDVCQQVTVLEFCNELSPPRLCTADTAAAILVIGKGFFVGASSWTAGLAHSRCSCCGTPDPVPFLGLIKNVITF